MNTLTKNPIGTIIDHRPDGSFIYQSHKGILNLDNHHDLQEAINEDTCFLLNQP